MRTRSSRPGHAIAVAALAVAAVAAPFARQDAGRPEIEARIAEASGLVDRRAFADAHRILESLAGLPAVAADARLRADVDYHTGNAFFLQNEYRKALESLDRSRTTSRDVADASREARALLRIAQAHKNVGEYADALARGLEVAALYERLSDADHAARAWTVVGSIQDLTGRYRDALESYRTAERLFAGSMSPASVMLLNETAITQKNLGLYDAALDLYRRALDGQRVLGDRLGQAITLLNTGNLHRALGEDLRALECYQQSLAIARELNERRGTSIVLSNLGDLLLARGDTGRARAMFAEQLEITRALGNRNEQALAILNLADTHRARGELGEAVQRYDEAIAIQRAIGAKTREAGTLLALGDTRLALGEPAAAGELASTALAIARDARAPDIEWRALHLGGRAARDGQRGADAIRLLRESAAIVNDLRANVTTDTGKIGFVERRQAVFHDLAGVLVASSRGDEALEAAEAGRARAFADLLAQRQVQGKPAERQPLEEIRTLLDEARAGPAPAARAAAGTRGGPLDERLASLAGAHGELASLLTAASPTLGEIRETAARLQATLVEYLVAERELLVWVVSPDGAVHAARTTTAGATLEAQVGELRTLLGRRGTGAAPPRLVELTRELHELLIAPIAGRLPPSPDDLVVIVPHGPLAVLPFAVLQDRTGQSLVARHAIGYAPAISVFRYTAAKRRTHPGAAGAALVVADATGPPEAAMPPLPGARAEGRLVAGHLAPARVDLLVGSDARESAVKRAAAGKRVVHVATHAVISPERPLASSLLLAPGDEDDGYLKVHEIFGLPLTADLVVLSGCSTGPGRPSGDGIAGLSRAFIYAGTPTVVVSQWDVSDRSTAFLMDRFYAALRDGRGPARALRAAQLAARSRFPHPYHWAAFVAIGEPR